MKVQAKRSNSEAGKLKELSANLHKDELLKRIKALAVYLQQRDQNDGLVGLEKFAQQLATPHILHHREHDVRLVVACCLADILRLSVPNPPYSQEELQAVMELFGNQLQGVEDNTEALYHWRFYLLETVAQIKAFSICNDLDNGKEIAIQIFEQFFQAVEGSKNTKMRVYMVDILASIIEDTENIDTVIMDTLMTALTNKNKTTKADQYQMACAVVERAENTLRTAVTQFFRDFLEHGRSSSSRISPSRIFEIIEELHRIAPKILLFVLPMLEGLLEIDDDHETKDDTKLKRYIVTRLLARMFTAPGSTLAEDHRALFHSFLRRVTDIRPAIRCAVIAHCKDFLILYPSLRNPVLAVVTGRLFDPDEDVRIASLRCICDTACESPNVLTAEIVMKACERMKDRKTEVREVATTELTKTYVEVLARRMQSPAYDWDDETRELFDTYQPIGDAVVSSFGYDNVQNRIMVEKCVKQLLAVKNQTVDGQACRLINMYISMEDSVRSIFAHMLEYKNSMSRMAKSWVWLCLQKEIRKEQLEDVQTKLADKLGDTRQTFDRLAKLRKVAGESCLRALGVLTDLGSLPEAKSKARAEVDKRIKELKDKTLAEILDTLLLRTSMPSVTPRTMPAIVLQVIRFYHDTDHEIFSHGLALLLTLAKHMPACFNTPELYTALTNLLNVDNNDAVTCAVQLIALITAPLNRKGNIPAPEPLHARLEALATEGNPKQAKYAARGLIALNGSDSIRISNLIQTLLSNLNLESERMAAALSALGAIAATSPNVFNEYQGQIVKGFIVDKLLKSNMVPRTSASKVLWTDSPSNECFGKECGIRVIVQRLVGLARLAERDETAKELCYKYAKPTFKLLSAIANNEQLTKDPLRLHDESRIRLTAVKSLVKLYEYGIFRDELLPERLIILSTVFSDPCVEVRRLFAQRIDKGLQGLKLGLFWIAVLALAARDPDTSVRQQVRTHIESNILMRRQMFKRERARPSADTARLYTLQPEFCLPYLVYLLAHHPQFDGSIECLKAMESYFIFLLEPLTQHHKGQEENFDFMYTLAESIQRTEDVLTPEDSKPLYMLSELLMLLIHALARSSNRTWKVQSVPHVKLPSTLFTPAKRNNMARCLPADYKVCLQQRERGAVNKAEEDSSPATEPAMSRHSRPQLPVISSSDSDGQSSEEENVAPSRRIVSKNKAAKKAEVDSEEEQTPEHRKRRLRSREKLTASKKMSISPPTV